MFKHSATTMLMAAAIAAAGLSGQWKIVQPGVTLICTFETRGDSLGGSCRPATGPEGVPISGTQKGRAIEWRFDIALDPHSPKQIATYRATMSRSGAAMRGTFSIADRRGRFTGRRE